MAEGRLGDPPPTRGEAQPTAVTLTSAFVGIHPLFSTAVHQGNFRPPESMLPTPWHANSVIGLWGDPSTQPAGPTEGVHTFPFLHFGDFPELVLPDCAPAIHTPSPTT